MDTTESNKLIAEFMGAIPEFESKHEPLVYDLWSTTNLNTIFEDIESDDTDAQHFFYPRQMKFHTSWDWLMPLVEKIEELGYPVEITETYCSISKNSTVLNIDIGGGDYTKISGAYEAAVEFIQWYDIHALDGTVCRNGKPIDECNCC